MLLEQRCNSKVSRSFWLVGEIKVSVGPKIGGFSWACGIYFHQCREGIDRMKNVERICLWVTEGHICPLEQKKKILSNLLCWNKNLFHPFGSSLAPDIAHWHFTVSQGCRNLSLVLLHCNHLLSHQLKGWKLQAKLKYAFYLFLCPDRSLQMNVGRRQLRISLIKYKTEVSIVEGKLAT